MLNFSLSLKLNISLRHDNNLAMNDWQDDIAKSLDEIDETRREMQQLQLHNAEVVKQKAPSRWRELSAAVEREVKRWSDKFQGRNERAVEFVRLSDTHFAVRKLYFPQVRLDVEFRLEAEVINYQYTRHESANS